jgi:hypothetical protein
MARPRLWSRHANRPPAPAAASTAGRLTDRHQLADDFGADRAGVRLCQETDNTSPHRHRLFKERFRPNPVDPDAPLTLSLRATRSNLRSTTPPGIASLQWHPFLLSEEWRYLIESGRRAGARRDVAIDAMLIIAHKAQRRSSQQTNDDAQPMRENFAANLLQMQLSATIQANDD